jgi:HPt (histidine-containing phosphotransfer) domain-containing protein
MRGDGNVGDSHDPTTGGELDLSALLDRVGGNRGFLRALVEPFREESAKLVHAIRDAAARDDRPALASAAHTLKGMMMNFDARAAAEVARRLEWIASESRLTEVDETVSDLERELDRVEAALRKAGARRQTPDASKG